MEEVIRIHDASYRRGESELLKHIDWKVKLFASAIFRRRRSKCRFDKIK